MVIEKWSHQKGVRAASVFLLACTVDTFDIGEVRRFRAKVPNLISSMLEAKQDSRDIYDWVCEMDYSLIFTVREEIHYEIRKLNVSHSRLPIGV